MEVSGSGTRFHESWQFPRPELTPLFFDCGWSFLSPYRLNKKDSTNPTLFILIHLIQARIERPRTKDLGKFSQNRCLGAVKELEPGRDPLTDQLAPSIYSGLQLSNSAIACFTQPNSYS